MKATIVLGSGNKNGNTEVQCMSFADALKENGFSVEIIRLCDLDIHHCNGCNKCVENNICCISDDMQVVYDSFDDCNLFVLATPVYFSGPSSLLKQMIDRFQCRWESEDEPPSGKSIALLCNGGSKNPRFENIISICRAFAIATRSKWLGECLVEGTDNDDTSTLSKAAYKFGCQISETLNG